jgi:hypothetical protein
MTTSSIPGRAWRLAAAAVLTLALAGCFGTPRRVVEPVRPAPSEPVQTADLAPPEVPEAPVAEEPLPGEDEEETEVAALPDPAPDLEIGRTDLLGGWQISSGGDTCQLFMSLTQWTGGYRASTRGCSSPELAGISAWELSGTTVTLKSGEGAAQVASLVATEPQRFSGSTAAGAPVTVSR